MWSRDALEELIAALARSPSGGRVHIVAPSEERPGPPGPWVMRPPGTRRRALPSPGNKPELRREVVMNEEEGGHSAAVVVDVALWHIRTGDRRNVGERGLRGVCCMEWPSVSMCSLMGHPSAGHRGSRPKESCGHERNVRAVIAAEIQEIGRHRGPSCPTAVALAHTQREVYGIVRLMPGIIPLAHLLTASAMIAASGSLED